MTEVMCLGDVFIKFQTSILFQGKEICITY